MRAVTRPQQSGEAGSGSCVRAITRSQQAGQAGSVGPAVVCASRGTTHRLPSSLTPGEAGFCSGRPPRVQRCGQFSRRVDFRGRSAPARSVPFQGLVPSCRPVPSGDGRTRVHPSELSRVHNKPSKTAGEAGSGARSDLPFGGGTAPCCGHPVGTLALAFRSAAGSPPFRVCALMPGNRFAVPGFGGTCSYRFVEDGSLQSPVPLDGFLRTCGCSARLCSDPFGASCPPSGLMPSCRPVPCGDGRTRVPVPFQGTRPQRSPFGGPARRGPVSGSAECGPRGNRRSHPLRDLSSFPAGRVCRGWTML